MKKLLLSTLLIILWQILSVPCVWAIDVGWMQEGVRVWYFGGVGSISSSDAEEAYLLKTVNGSNVSVTRHSGMNHWGTTNAVSTTTYSLLDKGPFWMHPQVLQNLRSGDHWMGFEIVTIIRSPYTYTMLPYRFLPAKALFDLQPQREVVKITYMIPGFSTGTAYFDAETGLCLLYSQLNGYVVVFFVLSEINYDFATHQAFAEDNGPHTGFKSSVLERQMMPFPDNRGGYLFIQSSVESRYGPTVEMWVSTSDSGYISSYLPPYESFCFFGTIPVLRRMNMSQSSNVPPDQWNEFGQYLPWWLPGAAWQNTSINVYGVPMERTSTSPLTFVASQQASGLYFTKLWFDTDGYLTQFAARHSMTGLDINPEYPGPLYYQNDISVSGLSYYKNTMGRAVPPALDYRLTMTVVSDTVDKGGGAVHGDGGIACSGHGSNPAGMNGICQADVASGTNANLIQTPDIDSTWGTWSVSGCGISQNCQVAMTGNRAVTITFPYSSMARVTSTNHGYESLALAFADAGANDTIYGRACIFTEELTLSENKEIALLGGCDAWYQPQNAWTTLAGKLTIRGGLLKVRRLVIR